MYDEMFNKTFANVNTLVEPAVKANKLALANFEKLVNFQMTSMQAYVDMGMNQLRAVSEIDSPKAAQAYMGKQMEATNALRQRMVDDTQALFELGNGFKDEMTKMAESNVSQFSQAAAAKAGTKKAA